MRTLRKFLATNAVGIAALFFALGGTAVAAHGLISGSDIAAGTITGSNVANDTLTGANIDESTLGKVATATNADQLGGLPAASYVRGYQVVQATSEPNPVGGAMQSVAACPQGTTVVGGGHSVTWYRWQPISVMTSEPDVAHNQWLVEWQNPGPLTQGLKVYAICANI